MRKGERDKRGEGERGDTVSVVISEPIPHWSQEKEHDEFLTENTKTLIPSPSLGLGIWSMGIRPSKL